MYVFDFGAPVGFRLAERHPAWITGLVVQNGNVYEAGLSEAARDFISLRPDIPGAEDAIRNLLTPAGTRSQYETGAAATSLISPDGWTLDQHFLDLPGRTRAQIELAFDYSENLKRYPGWQRWLRRHRPRTLIVWGRFDPFFPESGARAYLRDIPSAELHLLDTGHFALEDELATIAPLIDRFVAGLAPEQCGDKCRCGEETSSEWSASDGCDRIAPLCDPSAPCGPEDATA
jgi:pimeloyl-ACP methyl ester carboxylesterase